eukprot:UN26974
MADSEQNQLTVGYWDIRGLAQPIRMALALGGVEFKDKMYTCKPKVSINKETGKEEHGWDTSDWFDVKKRVLEKKLISATFPTFRPKELHSQKAWLASRMQQRWPDFMLSSLKRRNARHLLS